MSRVLKKSSNFSLLVFGGGAGIGDASGSGCSLCPTTFCILRADLN